MTDDFQVKESVEIPISVTLSKNLHYKVGVVRGLCTLLKTSVHVLLQNKTLQILTLEMKPVFFPFR